MKKKAFLKALFAVSLVFLLQVLPSLANLTVNAAEFEAIPNSQIEEITADRDSPGQGHITANLIDGSLETKWMGGGENNYTITVKLTEAVNVAQYAFTSAEDAPERDPSGWTVSGSTDGENWTQIDEKAGHSFSERHEKAIFDIDSPGSYQYYQFHITEFEDHHLSQLAAIELSAAEGVDPVVEDPDPTDEDPEPTDEDPDPTDEDPKPTDEDPAPVDNPQTSDMTNNSLYLVLAGGSLLAVFILGYAKKRSNA